MDDYERQPMVERAVDGCGIATLLLAAVVVLVVFLDAAPALGGLIIAAGLGLAVVDWAAQW